MLRMRELATQAMAMRNAKQPPEGLRAFVFKSATALATKRRTSINEVTRSGEISGPWLHGAPLPERTWTQGDARQPTSAISLHTEKTKLIRRRTQAVHAIDDARALWRRPDGTSALRARPTRLSPGARQ